jgi:hypothetical protein
MNLSLQGVIGRDLSEVLAKIAADYDERSQAEACIISGRDLQQIDTELDLLEAMLEPQVDDIAWHFRGIRGILADLEPYEPSAASE